MPPSQRSKTHRADFAVTIRYFDPDWGLLWGEEEGAPFFLPVPKIGLPVKNGDRVRLRGWISSRYLVVEPDELEPLPSLSRDGETRPPEIDDAALADNNNRLVQGRAYVEAQEMVDDNHVAYRAILGDRPVNLWLRLASKTDPAPLVAGSLVRFRGVCSSKTDSQGRLLGAEIWLGAADDLKIEGSLRTDKRFEIPVTRAEAIKNGPTDRLVRVEGRVRAQEVGYSVTLWDETGQVLVETAQSGQLPTGALIEAIGYPSVEGPTNKLERALFRQLGSPEPILGTKNSHAGASLRLVEQIYELSPSEAAGNRAVSLAGVVTWVSSRQGDTFYFQDATDGIRVMREEEEPQPLEAGDIVEIEGVSGSGKDAPVVRSKAVAKRAGSYLPRPVPVTLEQARAGVGFSRRVEISGFFREMEALPGGGARLWLATGEGDFSVLLGNPGLVREWLHALVSVRGVCVSASGSSRRMAGVELLASSPQDILLLGARHSDLFSLPSVALSAVGQQGAFSRKSQWVRTQGTVTFANPGQALIVQEGDSSLLVRSRSADLPKRGDRIDVVGLLGHEQTRLTLREAVFRNLGKGGTIRPEALRTPFELRPELDGCLVKIRAELVERSRRAAGSTLVLRGDDRFCEAWLDDAASANRPLPHWPLGSVLDVTGVYTMVRDESHSPWSFRILLGDSEDAVLVSAPSWLTLGRALAILGIFVAVAACALLWTVLLRRKVKLQTGVIREQMIKEHRLIAELERTSRLESLGTLAGGIAHDFNNILTIIICNLSLLRQENGLNENARGLITEAENGANRARTLTRQLLTFARGGNPMRRPQELEPVVREAARLALGGARLTCVYAFEPELRAVLIDREQLSEALQAILSRGAESMPPEGKFTLKAENAVVGEGQVSGLRPGHYVRLAIEDEGRGLSADQLERIFDPYFLMKGDQHGMGLATARSIVKRHEGAIEAHALEGRGMAFHLWLPASDIPMRRDPAQKKDEPRKDVTSSRILFMDDEEPLQHIAAALFKRMGCEATIVGEGSQALAAFEEARAKGKPFDLVIVDLIIPNGMGGRELIERLLRIEPSLRAIVSSGYSNDPVMANYTEHGFVAVVPKPYLIEDMEQAIRLALATPRRERKTAG